MELIRWVLILLHSSPGDHPHWPCSLVGGIFDAAKDFVCLPPTERNNLWRVNWPRPLFWAPNPPNEGGYQQGISGERESQSVDLAEEEDSAGCPAAAVQRVWTVAKSYRWRMSSESTWPFKMGEGKRRKQRSFIGEKRPVRSGEGRGWGGGEGW